MTKGSELKHLLKYWRMLANASGLAGTTRFPLLHWAWWFSTNLSLSTRGEGIQGTRYSCRSHYMKKNFVACKIATTYGEDVTLGGGANLNIRVF